MSTNNIDYKDLREELNALVEELQDNSLDIDTALRKHERATAIIKELEAYLDKAENTIKLHNQKNSKPGKK